MVRRVAAMEGQEMVNTEEDSGESEDFDVPKDHCWVLADNPDARPPAVIDSRSFGPLPLANIIGRVIYAASSVKDHGPVTNSAVSVMTDQPVVATEVDVSKMFQADDEL